MPSENTNILNLVGNVGDPTQTSQPDGSTPPFTVGRQGDNLASDLHGKFWTANYRNKVFSAQALGTTTTGITIPVVTATLASVFTLYNPPTSGVIAEIIDTTLLNVSATTVVDIFGWYASPQPQSAAGTFTTKGTVNSGKVEAPSANQVSFYSSYTHSGTPTIFAVIGGYGAVSNAFGPVYKFFDGSLTLPPGIAMSLAGNVAAGTTTGMAAEVRWVEWPL
jgi:hypothetical protein